MLSLLGTCFKHVHIKPGGIKPGRFIQKLQHSQYEALEQMLTDAERNLGVIPTETETMTVDRPFL